MSLNVSLLKFINIWMLILTVKCKIYWIDFITLLFHFIQIESMKFHSMKELVFL